MFGGYGVYADGLCFAIEIDGEVALGYRRLLASAYDDEDDLRRWAALGLAAALRAATAKRAKAAGRGQREGEARRSTGGGRTRCRWASSAQYPR
jgi:TfoX/Sxy family transcriptional regulator of competence genes